MVDECGYFCWVLRIWKSLELSSGCRGVWDGSDFRFPTVNYKIEGAGRCLEGTLFRSISKFATA